VRQAAVRAIASEYKEQADTLDWLKQRVQNDTHSDVRWAAVWASAPHYKEQPDTLDWLKQQVQNDTHSDVRREAVEAITKYYKDQPGNLAWIEELAKTDEGVKQTVIAAIVDLLQNLEDYANDFLFFVQCILTDSALRPEELQDKSTEEILEFLLEQNPEEAESILREVAQNYPDEAVRNWAQARLLVE
jgi:HEAT repeat protein